MNGVTTSINGVRILTNGVTTIISPYKWSYKPYKWSYFTLLTTGFWAHLLGIFMRNPGENTFPVVTFPNAKGNPLEVTKTTFGRITSASPKNKGNEKTWDVYFSYTWDECPQKGDIPKMVLYISWLKGDVPQKWDVFQLVVEPTPLKIVSQIGSFPQFSGWTWKKYWKPPPSFFLTGCPQKWVIHGMKWLPIKIAWLIFRWVITLISKLVGGQCCKNPNTSRRKLKLRFT